MTLAFREAIDTGRAILKDKWQGKHAKMDRQFGITELNCPLCGVMIAKLMPIGTQKINRVKNQTIIQEGVMLGYLANYCEAALAMNDGSRHVANMCKECAKDLPDTMTMVAVYAMNLSQWSQEGITVSDATCDRSPVSVLKVADYIKD